MATAPESGRLNGIRHPRARSGLALAVPRRRAGAAPPAVAPVAAHPAAAGAPLLGPGVDGGGAAPAAGAPAVGGLRGTRGQPAGRRGRARQPVPHRGAILPSPPKRRAARSPLRPRGPSWPHPLLLSRKVGGYPPAKIRPAQTRRDVRFCPVLSGSSPPVGGHRAPKTRQPGIPAGPPDGVGPARNDPAGGPRGTSWWQRPKRAIGPFLCSPVRGVPPGQFRACRNPVVRRTSGSSAGPRRGSSARPRPCATLPRQGTSFDSP